MERFWNGFVLSLVALGGLIIYGGWCSVVVIVALLFLMFH